MSDRRDVLVGGLLVLIGALLATGIILGGIVVTDASAGTSQNDTESSEANGTSESASSEDPAPTASVHYSGHECDDTLGDTECSVSMNGLSSDDVANYIVTYPDAWGDTKSEIIQPGESVHIAYVAPGAEISVFADYHDTKGASSIGQWTVTEDGLEKFSDGDDVR